MRKYNFYPGPSTIPASILERYREEILEYGDAGASFIELSHRSKEVLECHGRILAALRRLLGAAEEEYHVLLLPGGAIGQYAAVPMNLAAPGDAVAVAITGHWSRIAMREMARYCKAEVAVDTSPDCRALPPVSEWNIPAGSKYLAFVDNETIHGVEFPALPDAGDVPLVVDQSSNILSRPLDMKPVGALFACLQKNLGPTGLAVVVVRKDLCEAPQETTPVIWNYPHQAKSDSMANTPPTFQYRLLEMTLEWIDEQGGVAKLDELNRAKSALLYGYIDGEDFYSNSVDPACRSRMNVPFRLADEALDADFVAEAFAAGILGIKGHRAVGGMRASIYNAMPLAGVEALVAFMQDFAARRG